MVYLDYNASTPVDQRILPALMDAQGAFANAASSHHAAGQAAVELVEEARERVATLLRRSPQDIIFTSGATEAAMLGLVGAALGTPGRPNLVVGATEHKAVINAAQLGARLAGGEVRTVRVDRDGLVDIDHLADLVDDSVSLVAVMAANNETGVISPIEKISPIVRRHGALMFVDATQLIGKGEITDEITDTDLIVCSSHKIYGPKGAGALIVNRHVQKNLVPILAGGGQERGLRGGTHNTPSIVGFGLAAELVVKEQRSDMARLEELANKVLGMLGTELDGIELNGAGANRLSNTLNLRFVGADAEAVMASMPHVHVSAGSACQSAVTTPSHVLTAMGRSETEASESVRISLGRPTTTQEVQVAAQAICTAVTRVRELTD